LCGGKLLPGAIELTIRRGSDQLLIQGVAADICQQCGEAYLSAEVSAQLGRSLDRLEDSGRQ
jgi:YgiT-type zinc finger domain-containing protein